MIKLSWVLIFVVAIGLANDLANAALAGPHIYQGNGNDDEPSDDIGDDQSDDDDEDQGDDGDQR